MNKREKTINGIALALTAYDKNAPEKMIREAVAKLDAESIGVLHGITGVFCHAVHAKMPAKWLAQIHGDLLEAFDCLSNIQADERGQN